MKEQKAYEQKEREEILKSLSPEDIALRRRIVISGGLALFSINTLLLCGEAVLPTYIEEKHKKYIDETKISIMLG
jgi:hypothetical protein